MFKLLFLLIGLFPLPIGALELKVGDILLQPRDCWSCTLIELQENSIYSHMGLVIQTRPVVKVADALGKVKVSDLQSFNLGTQKNQKISVRRLLVENHVQFLQKNRREFYHFYLSHFDGLDYDSEFLWDNFDEKGEEKLYCSEMISKFLSGFLNIELPIKRMKFDRNREDWIKYFQGTPPDGKWGNAPADFEKSDLFFEVGEL